MKSKIVAGIGALLLVGGLLTLVLTTKEVVIFFRFVGGDSQMEHYIAQWNLDHAIVDGIVTSVLLGIGKLPLDRQLNERKPRLAYGIGIAVALLLGINAGLM